MVRVYSLSFDLRSAAPFDTHRNSSVGSVVSSAREHANKLKVASDRMSERTGMEHRMVPVDLRDRERCGITPEMVDRLRKDARDSGTPLPPLLATD